MTSRPQAQKAHCPYCGQPVYPSDNVCVSCGRELLPRAPVVNPPKAAPAPPQPYYAAPPPSEQSYGMSGWAKASLILAAVSLLFLPILLGPAGVICGIVAVVQGDTKYGAIGIAASVGAAILGMIIGAIIGAASFFAALGM